VNSEDIIDQYRMALVFCDSIKFSSVSDRPNGFNVYELLDTLAIAGIKLTKLGQMDYDGDGISIVSKALMYSVAENIESNHVSSISQESFQGENFDDYVEDDLDPEDFYNPSDFDEDTQV